MPLDSLLELVETLRARIDDHGTALRQNEMRTRYALIDPLLQELSWDTSNPSEVMIEDGSGDGRADYLLLNGNRPLMIIEAKRLGSGITDGRQQAVNYAMDSRRRARYFTVTDGNQWEIYDTHQPAINMMVISFALREDKPSEVCLRVLSLWRPSVVEGKVSAGQTPLVGLEDEQRRQVEGEVVEVSAQVMNYTSQPETVPQVQSEVRTGETTHGWVPLSELVGKKGDEPPVELKFPDDTQPIKLGTWKKLIVETARWLIDNSFLETTHYPIKVSGHPRTVQYLVASKPVHSNDKAFASFEELADRNGTRLFIFTGLETPLTVRSTKYLLDVVNTDPSQFKVRFSS